MLILGNCNGLNVPEQFVRKGEVRKILVLVNAF